MNICIIIVLVVQDCKCIYRRVNNFGYSNIIVLIMHVNYDDSNIPPFYQGLMNTWSLFSHQKGTPPSPVDGIPYEPLWYNSYS